jgi:Uma2 family endonuclease
MTTKDYLETDETTRQFELDFGMVREAAAPSWFHQETITRLAALLDTHVRARECGRVCVAPVDVVLDEALALVLQPDLVFVSTARLHLIRGQVWGAPDLVVEVLSLATARRDRSVKLGWYRRYGVREAWLLDPWTREVEVHGLSPADSVVRTATGAARIPSDVLPEFDSSPDDIWR